MEAVAQSNALQQSRDSRYAVEHEKAKWLSGSTAVCALFSGAEMLVAHVGDSEAVLCRDDRALRLTRQHNCHDDDERARVEAAGGWLTGTRTKRVNGVLGVSRAFGDIEYKLWKSRQWGVDFSADLVTVEPALLRVRLKPGRDRFAIFASDGLWDVFDRGEAVRKVLSWRAQAGTVDGVAAHLAAEAVARGNNDNCSVVVVEFVWGAEG